MRTITNQEREIALDTGTFEGVSLDDGIYVPVRIEVTAAGTYKVVFSEHGKEFAAEGDNSNLSKQFLRAHREFRLNQNLSSPSKQIS
jgi:hypothetical protein